MKKLLCLAAIAAASLATASAAVTTYTTRAAYDAAAGAQLFFLDFDGLVAAGDPGVFAGQIDFGSPEAVNPDLVNLNGFVGDTGSTTATNNVGPIGGEFLGTGVFGFGFDYFSGQIDHVDLYDTSSNLIGSFAVGTGGFFGLLSDTEIGSFVAVNQLFDTGGADRFFIDNFSANGDPVPLPLAAPLMAAGLGVLGLVRRRKKAAA